MTEAPRCTQQPQTSTAGGAAPAREDQAIDATPVGDSEHPEADSLPDLSRLSLRGGEAPSAAGRVGEMRGRDVSSSGDILPGTNVHITVHAHGSPVTFNIMSGAPPAPATGPDPRATPRVVRVPSRPIPTPSPARIRLAAPHPGAGQGGTTVATVTAAPAGNALAPHVEDVKTSPPPSPRLESAPVSTPASPALGTEPLAGAQLYEHIADRDPAHTRWYVVTAGRRVGIWREWPDMSDYVTRVPGNQHKLFNSRAEAEQHYYTNKALGNVQIIMP
ncbi:hypothetical protein OH76DRAFT_1490871 [Lentinus brumalis]|uniref:Ribonuclease H1 N-terminal domain-containing protein n=1 Tax=Lentinus brumalis TaxID=2498619 RepID=A0A371CHH0_9APHY|nr:hypothetical protein OH76DRAFT_1490871 [Polyporus brumalis]